MLACGSAHAADYTAANEAQLRAAIEAASADGDPSSTITLLNNVVLGSATTLPAFAKPVTVQTGSYLLTGFNAPAAPTAGGGLNFAAGSQLTNAGTLRGGKGGDAFRYYAGVGGAGVNLSSGSLRNEGTILGGQGGLTDAGGSDGFGVTYNGGMGGAGVALSGGSLTNNGRIAGGNGGSVTNAAGNTAHYFGGGGGTGAQLVGGSHANGASGTIVGGNGGAGQNTGGSYSGGVGGGTGLSLSAGATFVNDGAIAGGNGAKEVHNNRGGGGGIGASVSDSTIVNNGTIAGGTSDGGWSGAVINGAGGSGLALTNSAAINTGTIRGGLGGSANGAIAVGGAGVAMSNSTITNSGAILGGNGPLSNGVSGPGNVGIQTSGRANVITSGTISGGISGNGATQNSAIAFSGGNNALELQAGFAINGLVTATATDTLTLGGAADSTFSAASLGASAQYRGFGVYKKTGSSTWALTGTTAAVTPWQILGGTLSVSQDASLGAPAGALTINGGILQITGSGFANTARTLNWGAAGGGFDIADASHAFTLNQALTGSGPLQKLGAGTLVFTGNNSYTGGTTISAGTLQLGDGGTSGGIVGDVTNNGRLAFNRADGVAFGWSISGTGAVEQRGAGTTVLTGENGYTGGTTISAGTLQLGDGGTTGSIVGDVVNDSALLLNRSNLLTLGGAISGSGSLTQQGTGVTILSGANSYAGTTDVAQGTLVVNGDQSAASGATTVHGGATLAGSGTLGGAVTVLNGAMLAPGHGGPGTLSMGPLTLMSSAALNVDMGARGVAGGPLNDLAVVNGDLALDGTVNVALTPGGTFDPGLYRLINYSGTLTDNGLNVGTLPASATPGSVLVLTSIPKQVNLVNTSGLTLRFWDGANTGGHDNGAFDGYDGVWQASGDRFWTDVDPAANSNWTDNAFAVFLGTAGKVRVDDSAGPVNFAGAQFGVDGYTVDGAGVLTTTTPETVIRVGDGSMAGQAMTATINATIAGSGGIVKSDQGTLVLGGDNVYSGGTMVGGGTLQIARDANLGTAGGAVTLDGGTLRVSQDLQTARNITVLGGGGAIDTMTHTVTATGTLAGGGAWSKLGSGTLVLSGVNLSTGTTTVAAGTLRAAAVDAFGPAASVSVAPGATLDAAGLPQTVAGLVNGGTVSLSGATPGTTLTVRGNYVGQDGILLMAGALAGNDSPVDRLVIDGGTASGHTAIQFTNLTGLGAQTSHDGIEVVSARNGATTTAQTSRDAFTLAGGQINAGAFEYRLHAGDASGAGENWYLRSTLPAAPMAPSDPAAPSPPITYRPEVALYAALPAALAQSDMAMVGTLHQREGDVMHAAGTDGASRRGGVWARMLHLDQRNRQGGTVSPRSDGNAWGAQAGVDLFATSTHRLGLYGGVLRWSQHVDGFASGVQNVGVGRLHGHTNYAGLYWTYKNEAGWYSDVVVQQGWHDGDADATTGTAARIRGRSTLASVEVGKASTLNGRWSIEPQAQVIVGKQHLDDASIPAARFAHNPGTDVTSRVGLRLIGTFDTSAGTMRPYARVNLWHGFNGTDTISVAGPGAGTRIDSQRGYTSGEVAVGGTWTIGRRVNLYGQLGHTFAMGGDQRVSSGHTASVGLLAAW
jgi:autotransporter-associated beta strand protein